MFWVRAFTRLSAAAAVRNNESINFISNSAICPRNANSPRAKPRKNWIDSRAQFSFHRGAIAERFSRWNSLRSVTRTTTIFISLAVVPSLMSTSTSANSPPPRIGMRMAGPIRQWDWPTIALVLGIKVLPDLLMEVVASLATVHGGWLQIWDRWTRPHLDLAENGWPPLVTAGSHLSFSALLVELRRWRSAS